MGKTKDKYVSFKGTHEKAPEILISRLEEYIIYETNQPDYADNERLQGEVQALVTLKQLLKQLIKNGVWISDEDTVRKRISDLLTPEELHRHE
jgi:hypothetical protein